MYYDIIAYTLLSVSLLTITQLHDVGIVGPADNGQDEEYRNPLEHSHATAARCRLPSPIIVVAHARVWLLGRRVVAG